MSTKEHDTDPLDTSPASSMARPSPDARTSRRTGSGGMRAASAVHGSVNGSVTSIGGLPPGMTPAMAGAIRGTSPDDEAMLRAFEGKRPPRPKTTSATDGHHEASYHAVAAPIDKSGATPPPEPKVLIRQIDTDPMAIGILPPRTQDVPTDPTLPMRMPFRRPQDVSTMGTAPPPWWREPRARLALALVCGLGVAGVLISALVATVRAPVVETSGPNSTAPARIPTALPATNGSSPTASPTQAQALPQLPAPLPQLPKPAATTTRATATAGVPAASATSVAGALGPSTPSSTVRPQSGLDALHPSGPGKIKLKEEL